MNKNEPPTSVWCLLQFCSVSLLPSCVCPCTLFLLHFIIVSIQSGCNMHVARLRTSSLYLPALSFVTYYSEITIYYSEITRSVCYKSIWLALSTLLAAPKAHGKIIKFFNLKNTYLNIWKKWETAWFVFWSTNLSAIW